MSTRNGNALTRRGFTARLGDERGIAMAAVVLLGAFLVMVTVVVAARTMNSTQIVGRDRGWEQAIHVAENGIDQALFELNQKTPLTEATLPASPTKAQVVAAARIAGTDPAKVVSTPEGDVVVLKSASSETVYATGFSPGIEDPDAETRVVVLKYQFVNSGATWSPDTALATGGNIDILGDAAFGGKKGKVHSNKKLNLSGSASVSVCATGVAPPTAQGPQCPKITEIKPILVPMIDPLMVHKYAVYDVCRAGVSFGKGKASGIYAGPAYTGAGTKATAGVPCSGSFLSTGAGYNISGIGTANVTFASDAKTGAYYVDAADVTIGGKNNDPQIQLSVFAGTVDGKTDCSTPGGSISLAGHSNTTSYPGASNYSFIAGGDLEVGIQVEHHGILGTHQQLLMNGQALIVGSVIAEDACNGFGPVSESRINGGATIVYDGGLVSDFILPDKAVLDVVSTNEVSTSEL